MRTYAFLDAPSPIAFAHRGGAGDATENALSAFEQVARLGYRYVETDARTTRDGVPVVFHDADTLRLTGQAARVEELTLREVQGLALAGGEQVATLEQVLDAFPALRFNIDLKDAGSVTSVPPVLRRAQALERVCVTSFSERRIARARRLLGPDVCTGLGVGGVARLLAAGTVRLPRAAGHAAVAQLPWRLGRARTLPARVVELAHRQGLAVHVWTLDDVAAIEAALDLGVDGVMTDQPVVLKQVLASRGLWAG